MGGRAFFHSNLSEINLLAGKASQPARYGLHLNSLGIIVPSIRHHFRPLSAVCLSSLLGIISPCINSFGPFFFLSLLQYVTERVYVRDMPKRSICQRAAQRKAVDPFICIYILRFINWTERLFQCPQGYKIIERPPAVGSHLFSLICMYVSKNYFQRALLYTISLEYFWPECFFIFQWISKI